MVFSSVDTVKGISILEFSHAKFSEAESVEISPIQIENVSIRLVFFKGISNLRAIFSGSQAFGKDQSSV